MHMAFFNDIIILDERKDRNLKNVTFLARIFPPCPPSMVQRCKKPVAMAVTGFGK